MAVIKETNPLSSFPADVSAISSFSEDSHFVLVPTENMLSVLKTSAQDLADRVKTYVLERHCFQTFGFFSNVKRYYSLMTSAQEKGVRFCFAQGFRSLLIKMPIQDTQQLPWPVLHLFCRFDGLLCRALTDPQLYVTKDLVLQCLRIKERYSLYADTIDVILDCLRILEMGSHWGSLIAGLVAPYEFWRMGGSVSSISSTLALESIKAQESFARLSDVLEEQKTSLSRECSMSDFADESPYIQLTKKIFYIYTSFAKQLETVFLKFNAESLPKLALQYTLVYKEAYTLAEREKLSIPEFVLQKGSPSRPIIFPFPNQEHFPSLIKETLLGFSLPYFPSPDEYRKPLEEKRFVSLVDEYIQDFSIPKTLQIRPQGYIDFLPPHLAKQAMERLAVAEIQKIKKKSAIQIYSSSSHTKIIKDIPLASADTLKSAPLLEKSSPSSTSKTSSKEKPLLSEKIEEKSAPAPLSTENTASQYALPVHVGDGPNLERTYSDHAGRWALRGLDIFTESEYRQQKLSKEYKENILLYHSFGRALVEVIILLGKHFIKTHADGFVCESFTLPGEIIKPDGAYEKVIFTVSLDARFKNVVHMYATKKTPLTLVKEYAKDGFFAVNEEELSKILLEQKSRASKKTYPLPDDFSRVTEVSEEFVTVVQKDGVILNVYPFPDLM